MCWVIYSSLQNRSIQINLTYSNIQFFLNRVHVRRTDKVGTEAALHYLDEYMKHVDAFFDKYDLTYDKIVKRTVYLATDEVSVLTEAKSR